MARVVINRPVTFAYTQKVTRPLVARTCQEILMGAKRLAPRGTHKSGSGKPKRGRPLQPSLKSDVDMNLNFVTGKVGSSVNWAASEHQGSKPHAIIKRGRMLKFEWPKGNMILAARRRRSGRGNARGPVRRRAFFYFEAVMHPGNKRPVRYLTTPMHQFGRANGFRTSSLAVTRSRLP